MRLFCLQKSYDIDNEIILNTQESHRILDVLRMPIGSHFFARDPLRTRYEVQLSKAKKNQATLCVLSKIPYQQKISPIILWQAIPKQQRFQEVIPLAIEAGVTSIVPIITEHTQVSIVDTHKKNQRWNRLAQEAIDQSGNNDFLSICPAINLKEIFATKPQVLGLFAHQDPLSPISLSKVLKGNPPRQPIVLAIGPEGGFSEREISLFEENDFHSIYFSSSILRSEHAGLFFLGAIKMRLQESEQFYGEITSSKN
ncbi:MAG: RsmE family RNA methyltransferase [Spirochaetia bacterium]